MRKLLLLALILGLVLPAQGESTRFWRQDSYADFVKGRAKGAALRSDGELLLAPRSRPLADPNLEFLWAVVEDKQGNVYLGGGSPARVVRIDPTGQSSVVFESKELEVHALALDSDTQTLYLATSPDGGVYKLPRGGTAALLFQPNRKYLWDLVRHPGGALYLATGDRGEIFRITPDGQSSVFFSSGETHVRALALDAAGTLYAGTEPNGLVLRLTPQGEAFVLYEMPRKEVTALRFDSAGYLFVAAIGQKPKPPAYPAPTAPGAPQPGTPQDASLMAAVAQGGIPTPRPPMPVTGGSDIYRIAPDGYPQAWWSSAFELVYSLSFDSGGRLLAGTGNQGRLLAIDSPALFTYLLQAPSQQITTLWRGSGGRVFLGTANPGKLLVLEPQLEPEGSFESDVFDAQLFSQWGRISWQSRNQSAPGSVQLFTRSGNTSDPQKNWSAWSATYTAAEGNPVTSPPARFLQWRAALRASDSRTPSLSAVSVAYLRRNAAPVVERVIVQAPGVGLRGQPPGAQQPQPVQVQLPPPSGRDAQSGVVFPPPPPPTRVEPPPQGFAEAGSRSVLWSTSDDNDDDLVFAVYYRGEGETRWKLMKDNLTEKFYEWDAAALPDGAYVIKVVASDRPSNPPELALTSENVSDRFEVDNTPPRIDELAATLHSATAEVNFIARDSYSPLKRAEYSFDAGPWTTLFPAGGTTDAREHRYRFRLEKLEPGEHTVVVRVYDRFDNAALAKTTFSVK